MNAIPRVVFAGTPEFARQILAALLDETRLCVHAVLTQPDRPSGRGRKLVSSPVKQLALASALPVLQPQSLRDPVAQAELAALEADLMVVAAYGLILPQAVLSTPRLGCLNVHASLLPRWRGAAPIERAIEAGDRETGVTIMQMDQGLDTGAMLLTKTCAIEPEDTGASLREKLGMLGAAALLEALPGVFAGTLQPAAQDASQASYARKLCREEAQLDWSADAATLALRVRAFNPLNVCCTLVDGQTLRVWQASAETTQHGQQPGTLLETTGAAIRVACGTGVLRLEQLQLAGARIMDARSLLNGRAALFRPGSVLGARHR